MDLVECYCTNGRRLARMLTATYDEALAPLDLKVTQFALLRSIVRLDAPSITALAGATGLDRSTLGRNLRVLEKAGLIALGAGADERERVVTLTARGSATNGRADAIWSATQSQIETVLDPGELSALKSITAKLAARLGSES